MDIYVGNLPYTLTEDELRQAFEPFGAVNSVKIVIDRETGRSKGFGFVSMSDEEAANVATEQMNGAELAGRPLKVNVARPREEFGSRPPRGEGGGGFRPRGEGGFRPRGGSGGGGGRGDGGGRSFQRRQRD